MVDTRLLGIYLNDHLAGAVVGVELVKRIAKQNQGNDYGEEASRRAEEIKWERGQLAEIMKRLDIRRKKLRLGGAWIAEKAGRLKPNGQVRGYSPLSRLVELEGLMLGITGKLGAWRSLRTVAGEDLKGIDLEKLIALAEGQRDRVEALRIRAAREAFG